MIPEQRQALDEIIGKIRCGRMKRRTFLEQAVAIGLTSTAAMSLLEACGGTTNSTGGNGQTTNIVWQSEQDATNTYKDLTEAFNQSIGTEKGIHVTWQNGPINTNDMLTKYNNMFRARDASIDIVSVDIVYPAQFASNQWIVPISDKWAESERAKYLQGPVLGCTFDGKVWAAPYRTDIGLLYYRKDLVTTPAATFDELSSTAKGVSPSKIKYGYVWQGSQYEGLVCNFCEVLHGYGGEVLDPSDAKKVTVNSPEAIAALTTMVSWVGGISPDAVTTYNEDPTRLVFQNGDSAYMRNWPYAYQLGQDTGQSKIVDKFDVASIPYGGSGKEGHSAIGGWNLAINAFTPRSDQAWEFINYMMQPAAQKAGALGASWTTTLKTIYDDSEVISKQPLFGKIKPMLETALPRPVSPKYPEVSDVIQRNIFKALKKEVSPADALKTLSDELQKLV